MVLLPDAFNTLLAKAAHHGVCLGSMFWPSEDLKKLPNTCVLSWLVWPIKDDANLYGVDPVGCAFTGCCSPLIFL